MTLAILLDFLNNFSFSKEHHIVAFEKYVNPPPEIKIKIQKDKIKDKNAHKEIEVHNPWLITDIDYFTTQKKQ